MSTAGLDFIRLVVGGDIEQLASRLATNPALATMASGVGASRKESGNYFFANIAHYLYAGDTPLHMAAAAFRRDVAELLVTHGADCRAKNRRGAEPLHYAADTNHWDPAAQAETIEYLISVGADPNALDRSGVAPLHRAVRTRSVPAVRALLNGGADPRRPNKSGSTPLHLAAHTTGRSGSGSPHAREQQAAIVTLLLERGRIGRERISRRRLGSRKALAMKTIDQIRRSSAHSAKWEPCVTSDGRTIGEAEWLRRRTDGGFSQTAMLWRCQPMTFEYNFPGDESFLVISGVVRIALADTGQTIEFRTGDVASFPKGTRSTWTVVEPLEKFTVVSG